MSRDVDAGPEIGSGAGAPGTGDARPHLALAAGSTATARIDGISAAGAAPELLAHTPAADAELLVRGAVAPERSVPVSPTGCPTPALVTRAARAVLGFDASVLDAGLAVPTAAPTVDVGAAPGADVREPVAVPDAAAIADAARDWARERVGEAGIERLALAETVPGGTTTALSLLRALGERATVSSSLPENPLERKRAVVADALAASELAPGDCAGDPLRAVRAVGDPVQATLLGAVEGALDAGAAVELWGGTQQLAVAAALRHRDPDAAALRHRDPDAAARSVDALRVVTTSYVVEDPSAAVRALATDLDVRLDAVDPGFDDADHPGLARFAAGEAKEGVGMGGALGLAERRGQLAAVRERAGALYDQLLGDGAGTGAGGAPDAAGASGSRAGGDAGGP